MVNPSLLTFVWIGVAAALIIGPLLFGYYCAVKQTINCAGVSAADEPLFDRNASMDESMMLSADQIEQISDWDENDP